MVVGLVAGAVLGLLAHQFAAGTPALDRFVRLVSQPIGQVFLRLLFMLVIPLVFSALALGVCGLGDLRRLAKIGAKTLVYTVVASSIAVFLGVFLVNVLRPGEGMSEPARAQLLEGAAQRAATLGADVKAPKLGIDLLVQIVPSNVVRAAADNDLLAVMFFSLLIGIGLAVTPTPAVEKFREAIEGLYDVTLQLIGFVIRIAPLGAAALIFTLTAQVGVEVLWQLGRYVGVVLLALGIHQFGVYSVMVRGLGGMSPLAFFRGVQDAMITAFSTSSSNATLPTALRVAEEQLRLPSHISRFVLTIGSTANQNGTALFEGVTVLFLAQFYGVHLSIGQQTLVVLVCILGGIGTAGVPSGSLPVIAVILGMVGVPVEGIGLVLGVDRFLDMCRTVINVTGDLVAAVVVSRGESSAGTSG